jgi:hypothetical protein
MVISLHLTKCLHIIKIIQCLQLSAILHHPWFQLVISSFSSKHWDLRFEIYFQSSHFKVHYRPRPKVTILQFLTLWMEKFCLAPEQFLEFNTWMILVRLSSCGIFGKHLSHGQGVTRIIVHARHQLCFCKCFWGRTVIFPFPQDSNLIDI